MAERLSLQLLANPPNLLRQEKEKKNEQLFVTGEGLAELQPVLQQR